MILRKHQQRFIDENPDRAILNWEMRCLHPETFIYDPIKNISTKVKDIKSDFHVYSKTDNGNLVIAHAQKPKKYEKTNMIEIEFSNGNTITTTPHHRIWTGDSFVSSQQLIFSSFPLLTIEESCLSASDANAHHCWQKLSGLIYCYRLLSRLCDLLLHLVLNIFRDVSPLQDDVLQLCYALFYEDVQEHKSLHILLSKFYHLSKMSDLHLFDRKIGASPQYRSDLIFRLFSVHGHQKSFLSYLYLDHFDKVLNIFFHQSCVHYNKIREIRQAQSIEYYDFHVPIYNNYLCEGLIHHNTGKTLAASLWSNNPKRNQNPIVVCLKQNKKAWQREAPHATVYTKEEFKKQNIKNPSCLVLDEAHKAAAPLFTKGRSQLATCIYNFIKDNPQMHVLLLTATPVRNDPSSFHTLLCYIGVYIPWKEWRADFYKLETRPFLRFPAYFPRGDWRIKIREYVEKYTDIVSLRDCVDELPEERELVVEVDTPKYERPEDEIVTWTHEHKHEQTEKLEYIKSLEYRKLIIVCHYTDQIDEYAKELAKDKEVFVLDGRVKDQDTIKEQAKASPECYFIVQASMGMTWDGYMFGAMVFASMSHKSVDHTQMKGRLTSVDKSADVLFYYYLIGGRWDQRIYDTIKMNQDFNAHVYRYEESTRIT